MIFSSYPFLFVFLPIIFCGYHLLMTLRPSNPWPKAFLVTGCLVFYGYFHWSYIWIICFSMAANYLAALLMGRLNDGWRRNVVFVAGVIINLGLIGYFKYRDFALGSLNALAGTNFRLLHIMLPLGIRRDKFV